MTVKKGPFPFLSCNEKVKGPPNKARHDPAKCMGQAGWMPSAHALGLGDVRLKLTRPIAPPIWHFRGFEFCPFHGRVRVPPAAGLCPIYPNGCVGVYPGKEHRDDVASRWLA
jgi:hypothetical protein